MIDLIKLKIAYFILNKKASHNNIKKKSFTNLLKNSFRFLIIMPLKEVPFHKAIEVLKFFDGLNKDTIVFTQDFRVNLLPPKYRSEALDFSIIDVNKLKLPSKRLEKKIKTFEFDVVIDLEKEENLFNSMLVCLANAPVKIGFRKKNSDKYYSLQIDNMEVNPEIFYKNLLNCLQMF
ncbi:MAG: hypothetical protein WCA84_00420 [Ignavibacteriaceae bacterium]